MRVTVYVLLFGTNLYSLVRRRKKRSTIIIKERKLYIKDSNSLETNKQTGINAYDCCNQSI